MFLTKINLKKNKGFTLTEILIVMIVLSLITVMTVPAVVKSLIDMNHRTKYRVALRKVSALTAGGKIPRKAGVNSASILFDLLNENLGVKGYVGMSNYGQSGSGGSEESSASGVNSVISAKPVESPLYKNWIFSEDNIAYHLVQSTIGEGDSPTTATTAECGTKEDIIDDQGKANKKGSSKLAPGGAGVSDDDLSDRACFIVYVDVNGPVNGPNTLINNKIDPDTVVEELTFDIFPIYIGADGAVAGNPMTTKTGRVNAGMK